jgi:hypothetical protein
MSEKVKGRRKVAAPKEQFIVDAKGKKIAVILSMPRYRKLLEDLHDLAVIAERREEKPISLEEIRKLQVEKDCT